MDRLREIVGLSREMSAELDSQSWDFQGYVLNPLDYAWDNYSSFLSLSIRDGARILFLGMNPGPYGMMQTGVPFGEVDAVRNYLGITGEIDIPEINPPLKPVIGMGIKRHEVSGRKFWKMASDFGSPDEFFEKAAVFSFCPLAFIDGRRNITPDELPKTDRNKIDSICMKYLERLLEVLKPSHAIALGHYAEKKLEKAGMEKVEYFSHPSPRSSLSMAFWDSGEALERFRRLACGS